MGYSHNFYALDVSELIGLYRSQDENLLQAILTCNADEIEHVDQSYEIGLEDGDNGWPADWPDTASALRQIIYGNPKMNVEGGIYGEALQIICSHLGTPLSGGDYGIADVADHPYDSLLVKSGSPIPIPEPTDWPVIGYLHNNQIDDEIALATTGPKQIARKPSNRLFASGCLLFSAALGQRNVLRNMRELWSRPDKLDYQAIREDIDAYVETLKMAKHLGKGIVSFRH